jgi:hypothetical protein
LHLKKKKKKKKLIYPLEVAETTPKGLWGWFWPPMADWGWPKPAIPKGPWGWPIHPQGQIKNFKKIDLALPIHPYVSICGGRPPLVANKTFF